MDQSPDEQPDDAHPRLEVIATDNGFPNTAKGAIVHKVIMD
jgi:hypothetical protein